MTGHTDQPQPGRTSHYETAPVRVFVAWHPQYSEGETLFLELYNWLGGAGRDLYRRGLGVPVQAWTSQSDDIPPSPIPESTDRLTVVVAILDGEFLGRVSWRNWLSDISKRHEGSGDALILLPWAVHPGTAFVEGVSSIQLLGAGPCDATELCRQVTQACVTRLQDPKTSHALRIFISYAQKDGAEIARNVRTALQNYGHLSVFLDEHDLQPGEHWRGRLSDELTQGAAMFAIVTDTYASRAWCREELWRFREPQKDPESSVWYLRPVCILDSLSGAYTRSMFELGNAPVARWNPKRATEVVDALIREVLFSGVNRLRAQQVTVQGDIQIINWVPDTWTLLQIIRRLPESQSLRIAYPGDGLPKIELERLIEIFPQVSLEPFEHFERDTRPTVRRGGPQPKAVRTPLLLSVSDPPASDLARNGFRRVHLDDAAVRIARRLLRDEFDVMYGGTPRSGFTEGFQDDSGAVVIEERLINYLGWPYSRRLNATQIADAFGVTRYARVPWDREETEKEDDPWANAEAASHTRRRVVQSGLHDLNGKAIPRPGGLIALGGQLAGFSGFLPGVAEEIAVALEAGLAVYVLGGFGGAAHQVAQVLLGNKSSDLTFDTFLGGEKYQRLREKAIEKGREPELRQHIEWMWGVLHGSNINNGLSEQENIHLWTTVDLGQAIALIAKGLSKVVTA